MTRMIRRVVCVAAAGPRRGFGHLVRCGVVARALGVPFEVVLRSSPRTAATARRLGWRVLRSTASLDTRPRPDLVVVDDPSTVHAGYWVRQANLRRIPVATIHDLGLGRVPSDLSIDGSPVTGPRTRPADLQGPAFAILDPAVGASRVRRRPRPRAHVLIALGGGARGRRFATRLARTLVRRSPLVTVDLVAGFAPPRQLAPLPPRCRWVHAPNGLASRLAGATVAVIAGGVTLYEACALGTPAVAVPIVRTQRLTIGAFASAAAVLSPAARASDAGSDRVAAAVLLLLRNPRKAAALARSGSRLVDGRGASRVTLELAALVRRARRIDSHVVGSRGRRVLPEARRAA